MRRCAGKPDFSHFNPRSPHGERLPVSCRFFQGQKFQSTLPARGATILYSTATNTFSRFQSTLPARGATNYWYNKLQKINLFQSTLPARGATDNGRRYRFFCPYFNPRSPHGERLCQGIHDGCGTQFQSTLPARGATHVAPCNFWHILISIHAPRTGSDCVRRYR